MAEPLEAMQTAAHLFPKRWNAASQLRCWSSLLGILWKSKAWNWLEGIFLDRHVYTCRKRKFWQWSRQWIPELSFVTLREWLSFHIGKIKLYSIICVCEIWSLNKAEILSKKKEKIKSSLISLLKLLFPELIICLNKIFSLGF